MNININTNMNTNMNINEKIKSISPPRSSVSRHRKSSIRLRRPNCIRSYGNKL